MSRPEHQAPPDVFYNDTEARKYTRNSRIIKVQKQMAERALELLDFPEDSGPKFLLDIGCGSGLSGEVLSDAGHIWSGIDISTSMLEVATEKDSDGDLFESDMGLGLFFRAGVFDGVISISAIQWLCQSDRSEHIPFKRLVLFFNTLYACLTRGASAVFQFYPENPQQMELITSCAMKAGFSGGLVVDNPTSSKAKKMFLVLHTTSKSLPSAVNEHIDSCPAAAIFESRRSRDGSGKGKPLVKSKEWIAKKKDRARRQGKEVKSDSKYSGRKRKPKF
ncbi:hypothetical protein GEMRC1_003867 [Eukaryota sp. GEM-RC1]